jgi:hypothetical protein
MSRIKIARGSTGFAYLPGPGCAGLNVAYERYLSDGMTDFDLPQERIDAALASLPAV